MKNVKHIGKPEPGQNLYHVAPGSRLGFGAFLLAVKKHTFYVLSISNQQTTTNTQVGYMLTTGGFKFRVFCIIKMWRSRRSIHANK